MEWVAISCAVSGFLVGYVIYNAAGVFLSSVQIFIYLLGFSAAGELGSYELIFRLVVGLSAHQAAYLFGVIAKSWIEASVWSPCRVAEKVDSELGQMARLTERIEDRAPEVRAEIADLSRLLAEVRRTLEDQQRLERLLKERRSAA